VLDAFDNSRGRRLVQETCRALALPCLHVGLNADYAEVRWDEGYRVPDDVGTDECAYPLARHLVLLAATVAAEVVVRFAATGARDNYTITLRDFAICAVPGN
jgi:molybdopterin/thiamine biosynthesis adenylyltransferase